MAWKDPERAKAYMAAYYAKRKEHIAEANQKWAENNRARSREIKTKWREANRDKARESQRRYYERNKETKLALSKEYRDSNKERAAQTAKAWAAANRLKRALNEQKRRSRKVEAGGVITPEDVTRQFLKQEGSCLCGAFLLDAFHIDHVVPLSRGGSNAPSNMQLLCPKCNLSKGAKLMAEWRPERTTMSRSEDVKTPLGIFSFTADLFKPREQEGGKKKYGCTILFDKTADLAKLQEAALKAATDEWGDKAVQWIKDGIIKSPFLDGDGPQGMNKKRGERNPGFAGRTFLRCSSGEDYKPKVYDRKMNPVGDPAEFPSGSQGYGVVNFWTWEHPTNGKGISVSVSLVQAVKKAEGAEILGGSGGPSAEDHFEKIEDEGGAPDSTKTGAGASGLFG